MQVCCSVASGTPILRLTKRDSLKVADHSSRQRSRSCQKMWATLWSRILVEAAVPGQPWISTVTDSGVGPLP